MDTPRLFRTLGLLTGAAVAGAGAHQAQLAADQVRAEQQWQEDRVFLPDPAAVKVAVLGFDQLAASIMWVRSVLVFSDCFQNPQPEATVWLRTMLQTVHVLDPGWQTLYEYGGGMLRLMGDLDGSDELYQEGAATLPTLSYFPFSLAMNAYIYRKDPQRAFAYMKQAAALPDAPPWYRVAAAGFLNRHGQRDSALHYLSDQIKAQTDPGAKQKLERKYREVLGEEVASRLEEIRAKYREDHAHDISTPQDLGELPDDPLGGTWVIGADHQLRSSVAEDELRTRAQKREQTMLRGMWKQQDRVTRP